MDAGLYAFGDVCTGLVFLVVTLSTRGGQHAGQHVQDARGCAGAALHRLYFTMQMLPVKFHACSVVGTGAWCYVHVLQAAT
jgi:hypothetical protein